MNYSKHREIILKYLKSVKIHPTADTIYANIKEQCPSMSLATVYRNLNQLADNQIITRIKIDGVADRFDGDINPHNHLYCGECSKIYDLPVYFRVEDVFREIESNCGFIPKSCEVLFKGTCKNCQK